MTAGTKSYSLFYKFIETYSPLGFRGINPDNPLVKELEELMKNNNQFFFIGDLLQMKILFTSARSTEMMGIAPEDLTPYHFREGTHPDDAQRQGLGTAQLFRIANQIFIEKEGTTLVSISLKIRNSIGIYSNTLIQCYLFYSPVPNNTVYILQLMTDINEFKKIKNGFHYYVGKDLMFFRYPDDDLLRIGNILSDREFEIIKLVESGMNSEQIAAKLFLSVHTVNTHRSNILNKTGFNIIPELIIDFQKRGLM